MLQDSYLQFKIIIVGNGGVGKSSLMQRYCSGYFSKMYKKTIGVDFLEKQMQIDDKDISLFMWDTAGQEEYQAVTRAYYRGAHAALVVYSVTDKDSFHAIPMWVRQVRDELDDIPLIIVQNKSDLMLESKVTREEGNSLATQFGVTMVMTSAKENQHVDAVFRILAEKCVERQQHKYEKHKEEGKTAVIEPDKSNGFKLSFTDYRRKSSRLNSCFKFI